MVRCREMGPEPAPLYRPDLEAERTRIEEATRAFLAKGGEIRQVGFRMSDQAPLFVIDPKRTPVYAHLFEATAVLAEALSPDPEPLPVTAAAAAPPPAPAPTPPMSPAPADPEPTQEPVKAKVNGLAVRVMVQASLGATPKETAKVLGISEKSVRQLARDYHITFKRQR